MILGISVVEDELSDAQMVAADTDNDNITNGITGVATHVYEVTEVDIDEDR